MEQKPKEEHNIINDWLEKNGDPQITKQVEIEAKELCEQEKRYSEDEVKKIALDFFYHWWNSDSTNTEQCFDKWFKQIKC